MKVCIVSLNIVPYFLKIDGSQFGGAEVQAAILAGAFESAGADVTLVVADLADGQKLPFSSLNAFHSGDGIPGIRFFYPRLTGILNALDRADADVYFQHCAGMITGITSWYCKRRGKIFVYFAGSDTDFSFRDVVITNLRDKLIFFWGLRNAAGIAVQNEIQARLCREKFKKEPVIIPTAVELGQSGAEAKNGSVVWVGALRDMKRPELFLELARRLPEVGFVLIGGGVSTQPEFCRTILSEAALVPNVEVTNRVPQGDVEAYLGRAALLVNTSSFEGFPNAFLEAWKCETPILSFVDVDGLLESEGVGIVCRDMDDMVGQAARLLGDENKRLEMGKRARRLIEERYSAPKLARRYLDFFEGLMTAAKR